MLWFFRGPVGCGQAQHTAEESFGRAFMEQDFGLVVFDDVNVAGFFGLGCFFCACREGFGSSVFVALAGLVDGAQAAQG